MGVLLVTEKHSCKWLRVEELPCMTTAISFHHACWGIDPDTVDNGRSGASVTDVNLVKLH